MKKNTILFFLSIMSKFIGFLILSICILKGSGQTGLPDPQTISKLTHSLFICLSMFLFMSTLWDVSSAVRSEIHVEVSSAMDTCRKMTILVTGMGVITGFVLIAIIGNLGVCLLISSVIPFITSMASIFIIRGKSRKKHK